MALAARAAHAQAPAPISGEQAAWIRQAGFRPVDGDPLPLDLPDVEGVAHALTERTGTWTLVSFFATWCGPCASELPALSSLHRALEPELQVLGVSEDSNPAVVPPFMARRGGLFPVWMDVTGRAGARWSASALPTAWLVDPDGRRVGAATGARDWHRAIEPLSHLIGRAAAPPAPPRDPPVLAVDAPAAARAGDPFWIEVRTETRPDVRVLGPNPGADPADRWRVTRTEAVGPGENGALRWRVEIVASQAGPLTIDGWTVAWIPSAGAAPEQVALAPFSIDVAAPARPLLAPVIAAAALAAGIAAIVWRRWPGPKPPAAPEPLAAAADLRRAGAWMGWAEALRDHALSHGVDPSPYQTLIERIRYGGHRPDALEAEAAERDLRRRSAPETR